MLAKAKELVQGEKPAEEKKEEFIVDKNDDPLIEEVKTEEVEVKNESVPPANTL